MNAVMVKVDHDQGQEVTDKLRMIMEYPLTAIRNRVLAEGLLDGSVIDTAISEYRKFLALIASGFRHLAMCSKEVDEIWHNHILFTQDYMDFCQNAFGAYLHHQPNTVETPVGTESVERFVDAYTTVFGQLDPIWSVSNYWPCLLKDDCDGRLAQGCGTCGGKCVSEEQKKRDREEGVHK